MCGSIAEKYLLAFIWYVILIEMVAEVGIVWFLFSDDGMVKENWNDRGEIIVQCISYTVKIGICKRADYR